MPIDLYHMPGSAPCMAVILTAKALGVDLNLKFLNLMEGEHLKPEFLKLNPQHTIPTMVDDGLALYESRAIMTYLVNKYGKGSDLYPEDPKARALVDQRLYFDIGTLLPRLIYVIGPKMYGHPPADEEKLKKLDEGLKLLDTFLDGENFVAGPYLTLADISMAVNLAYFKDVGGDYKNYPNIVRWYQTVQSTIPGYEDLTTEAREAIKMYIEMKKK